MEACGWLIYVAEVLSDLRERRKKKDIRRKKKDIRKKKKMHFQRKYLCKSKQIKEFFICLMKNIRTF